MTIANEVILFDGTRLIVSVNTNMPSAKEKAVEFRKWAAECLEVAERMSLKDDKARMIAIAEQWLELARQVERKMRK